MSLREACGAPPLYTEVDARPRETPDATAILAILEAEGPAAAAQTDLYGRKPLHWLCSNRSIPVEALRVILAACPSAASIADLGGMTPLMHACACAAPLQLEVLEALLAAHPGGAAIADADCRYALHHALKHRSTGGPIELRTTVRAGPDARLTPKACLGDTPRLGQGSRAGVVLRALPGAASRSPFFVFCPELGKGDWYRPSALERASAAPAETDVIERLLVAHPQAASIADAQGCFPLHHAAAGGAPVSVVRAVLAAHPGAAAERDHSHFFPLHWAAERGSLATVAELLRAHPPAASEHGKSLELPLHLAMRHLWWDQKLAGGDGIADAAEAAVERVRLLLEAHPPAACAAWMPRGETPLSLAVACQPPEVVSALLTAGADPRAPNDVDRCGGSGGELFLLFVAQLTASSPPYVQLCPPLCRSLLI